MTESENTASRANRPVVAVVGRPNVGKSTLFNALAGETISIVKDTPGITRDRIYADVSWLDRTFTLIDTGGIEPDSQDVILSQMRAQAQIAIETADVIIFLVDVKQGLVDADAKVADMLRRSRKPVVLVVNKVDSYKKYMAEVYEFYNLGIGEPHPISAVNRLGLGDMLEELFLYTKLTSVEFELNMSEIQVFPLLGECLVGLYRQFEEKGVAPEVEFQSEGFRVKADEECLRRIFHNLIQNGLLHGKGGITIRQRGCSIFFENLVSETSMPDPEQIFDRFYKADSARRKGSSGLGMFIVKELMERMGGQSEAKLTGQRLTIRLDFPEVG